VTLFGYMVYLIFLKWAINWFDPAESPGSPPSLIDTLINIALKPGVVDEPMYAGQAGVQTVLLLVAFACVPWLLMAKPLYLKRQHDAEHAERGGAHRDPDTMAQRVREHIAQQFDRLVAMPREELLEARFRRLMSFGSR
jgi:V-type H+-transporting ATPase subunit a